MTFWIPVADESVSFKFGLTICCATEPRFNATPGVLPVKSIVPLPVLSTIVSAPSCEEVLKL